MNIKSLTDLYITQLNDIYYAEKQLWKILPRMAEKTMHPDLLDAFEMHTDETAQHIERLEKIFEMMRVKSRLQRCDAIEGLIDEAKNVMGQSRGGSVCDAALLFISHKIEHYEISSYSALYVIADTLGHDEHVALLKRSLSEEKTMDRKLGLLAERYVNIRAKNQTDVRSTIAA